jgi:flagellar biogenesis protein FliO
MAPDVSVGHLLVQMVLWLGVIVAALFALSRLARRSRGSARRAPRTPGAKRSRVAVVSRQPVGKGQWIAVVEAEGHRFVVGISGAGFTPLGELRGDAPRDEAQTVPLASFLSAREGEQSRGLLDRARAATVRR